MASAPPTHNQLLEASSAVNTSVNDAGQSYTIVQVSQYKYPTFSISQVSQKWDSIPEVG